jgi:hypothetical protein
MDCGGCDTEGEDMGLVPDSQLSKWEDAASKLLAQLKEREARIERLEAALRKVREYNEDIAAGRINYRPEDHIEVIDSALLFND